MIEKITTQRLVLRKARDEDLPAIWHNVWADNRIAASMLWKTTDTAEEAVERLEKTKRYQAANYAYFVCRKENDEPIGFAGIRETAPGEYEETGICVAFDCQNRGFGTEILRALVDLAFGALNGNRFLYGCFHTNVISAAVCRKCGFQYLYSQPMKREWDGYEYLCDFYELRRD